MTDLTIRAAHPDDVPPLTTLMNLPGVRWGTARLPYTREDFVRRRMIETDASFHLLVGLLDDRLVANASLVRMTGRRSHCGDVGLFVHDDYRGRGIGRRMMEALLDLADNWLGLTRLQLTVNLGNERAIRLYTSLGFENEGTQRALVLRGGVLVDAHTMARLRPAPRRGEGASGRAHVADALGAHG